MLLIWGLIYILLGIFTVYQLIVSFRAHPRVATFVDEIGIWNAVLGVGGAKNWQGFGISPVIWTLVVMTIGILLGLLFIYLHRDIFYALVVNWALFGIYLKRVAEGTAGTGPIITWSIIGIIILTLVIILAFIRRHVYVFNGR